MVSYLPRIERPRALWLKLAYFFMRRQLGMVPTPIAVFSARMPLAFLLFSGKISRLDRKLKLPEPTAVMVREQVAGVNGCLFCMDIARWFTMRTAPGELLASTRCRSTGRARCSPTPSEPPWTTRVSSPGTGRSSQRRSNGWPAITVSGRSGDIVWLVASEHFYNVANHGLGIGSDGLCELSAARSGRAAAAASTAGAMAGDSH